MTGCRGTSPHVVLAALGTLAADGYHGPMDLGRIDEPHFHLLDCDHARSIG